MGNRRLINFNVIGYVIGSLLMINGFLMALPLGFSFYHQDGMQTSFILSSLITFIIGFGLRYFLKQSKEAEIKRREGFLIVSISWLAMALFGSLPYVISESIPNFSNAFFETMSGFSTTGASILNNIEEMPESILFWRSMTQWIGGMGIIVLTIAILPLLGIGGMELFVNEAPGPTKDKIHPRIKETAKRLWIIYLFLTLSETVVLMFCGMNFF
ncbi:MAG: potassium transporter TrkG, partial [Flavobacteriales bacterium]